MNANASKALGDFCCYGLTKGSSGLFWRIGGVCRGLCLTWLLAAIMGSVPAMAETTVGGPISGDTVWQAAQGPYLVNGDVTIISGATLTIEAGTTVFMSSASNLVVSSGALRVAGTAESPVRITSLKVHDGLSPAAGDWGQLRFLAATNATKTLLEHTLIEYGAGLVVNGAAPTFNHLDIRNHSGPAIALDLAASPSGVGNIATGNQLNAVLVPSGEITGSVNWGLRGIPYLVSAGIVSVGAAPKVSSVSPATLEQGATATFTLTGTRLAGPTSASFANSGLMASILSGGTATQTSLSVSASATAALGPADVKLLVDAGEVTVPAAFAVIPPQPAITVVAPASVYVGQGPTSVDVSGRNFVTGSEILVNGVSTATTLINANLLRFTLGNQTAAGTLSLKARIPDPVNVGQYYNSNSISFAAQTPQLTLSPTSARVVTGTSKSFSVGIPFAAPAGGYAVNLASAAPTIATVPSSVVIPQGATTGSFDLNGIIAGNTTLAASRSGAGSIQAAINVVPPQSLSLLPALVMISPTGLGNNLSLKLGYADVLDQQFGLSTDDPTIATVSPATVTIPAGQTTATISAVGVAAGNTRLRAAGTSGLSGNWPVYVASEITGALTVDGAAMPLSLAQGQKARLTFAGTSKQLLGLTVGSMATVPAGGSLTIYVDRADGSTIGTCPFSAGDVCHLNSLPATETYTLRVVPNAIYTANLSVQVVTELTGMPTSGPVGPIVTPSIGVQKGAMLSPGSGNEVIVTPAVGIMRGYANYSAVNAAPPTVAAPSVGIQKGDSLGFSSTSSTTPMVVTRPIRITK
ncbi:MAG TPA: hypothetical protein VI279_15085 [Rhodocyclaceae bacterium]